MSGTTRRGMLAGLLTEFAQAAEERLPGMGAGSKPAGVPPAAELIEPEPAPTTSGAISDGRLEELIADCGLGELGEAVRSVAVRGARLRHESDTAAEPLDPAGIPAAIEVDLGTLPHTSPLPVEGVLRVEVDADARAAVGEHGPVDVTVSLGRAGEGPALGGSPELTLPRAWSARAQALGVEPGQVDPWEELRRRIADAHGVELTDEPLPPLSIHRLFGYPDERTGQMPVWCELLERGVDLGGEPPFMHPMAPQVQDDAMRWRLLLQASRDPQLGWRWGGGGERFYVWALDEDLADQSFARTWAFIG